MLLPERIKAGKPSNTGLYLTDSGDDVTVPYRDVNDNQELC